MNKLRLGYGAQHNHSLNLTGGWWGNPWGFESPFGTISTTKGNLAWRRILFFCEIDTSGLKVAHAAHRFFHQPPVVWPVREMVRTGIRSDPLRILTKSSVSQPLGSPGIRQSRGPSYDLILTGTLAGLEGGDHERQGTDPGWRVRRLGCGE